MSPRQETYTSQDGRSYTLWADIHDLMSAVMPAYWSADRNHRSERGWMFRGQSDADWALTPSLYRPPADDGVLAARREYTAAFVSDLRRNGHRYGLERISDTEYLAIAQHYGLYTALLDFTWNVEVAAYFASTGATPGKVGVIYAFNAKEYQEMRNPFAALGSTIEMSDETLRGAGMEPLPDLEEITDLHNVPRVYEQEGLFIHARPESVETLTHNCIDRYYFRQRVDCVYSGAFAHKRYLFPDRDDFDSDESYEGFLDLVRNQRPDLLEVTQSFGSSSLFPPADPLSKFAETWKREHPILEACKSAGSRASRPDSHGARLHGQAFTKQMEDYYYGDFADSPYQKQYLLKGREFVESLCSYKEMDSPQFQRALLWEMLKRNLPAGMKCTLKLGSARSCGSDVDGFRLTAVDRWLADSFSHDVDRKRLQDGFCRVVVGELSRRGRPKIHVTDAQALVPPRSVERPAPVNPHDSNGTDRILHEIEAKLADVEAAVVESFLYDFHNIVMLEMGRNLEFTVGLVGSAPCLQRSPLTRQEHVEGPALLVRLSDHFTGGVTHTAVCEKHWNCLSEGDVDLMHASPWTMLGLA